MEKIFDIILWPFLMFYLFLNKIVTLISKLFIFDKKTKKKNININKEVKISKNDSKNKASLKIRYKYSIKNRDGKIVNGYIDSENESEAKSFLISQGFQILMLRKDNLSNKLGLVSLTNKRIKIKDLTFFLTQLSTYIKAGIPLTDSMIILSNQAKKKKTKNIYEKVIYQLNKGDNFSIALMGQGKSFPKLLINMIKTAELTGNLTEILDDMSNYYKTTEENRKQIISALTYPSIILVIAVAILTFIILYVVPQFVGIYDQLNTELPTITKIIINISDYVNTNILQLIAIIAIIIIVFIILYKNITSFKYTVQWILMHLPVVKNIIIYKEMIMFTKTFSSLIKHDVFITDTMEILRTITSNEIYKIIINDAINSLSNGEGISPAFKGQWAFPPTAYEMLLTGERTGKMGPMMENVASYYESSQKALVTQLKSLIEPIMIVFLAFMVGTILLAVIIPMFDMYKNVI